MRTIGALIAVVVAQPAIAHDLPKVKTPDDTVVVQQPLLPEFGRIAGEGRVRLVYHSPDLAARLGVNDFYAYELAYQRRLTRLMQRMSFEAADPIARHGAWHDIVGRNPTPSYTTGAAPE